MIVRDKPTVWHVFFVLRGSIVLRLLPLISAVAALSLAIVVMHRAGIVHLVPIQPLALSVIGAALAIFAAFRNAAAYDRWWEARKLLGLIVIETRNLARQTAYIKPSAGDDAARYLRAEERAALEGNRNPPNRLLDFFSVDIATLLAAGRLPAVQASKLEERVQGLMTGFASAERTKTTPMPFVYTLLVHRTAYIFCLLIPFGLADSSGNWTPLLAAIVSYTFFALDAIGDDLSVPFGPHANFLPLDAIARAVEINILQSLGEKDIPEPWRPQNFLRT